MDDQTLWRELRRAINTQDPDPAAALDAVAQLLAQRGAASVESYSRSDSAEE